MNDAAREQGQYRTPHLNSNLSLEGLSLTSIGASDSPLDGFLALVSLSLAQNQLNSLGHLNLPGLRRLSVCTNRFETLSFVSGFQALRWLDVSSNQLRTFVGVNAAPLLSHLVARRNQFCDAAALQPLSELPSLSTLEIEDNRLSLADLTPLEQVSQLRVLGVAGNPLGLESVAAMHDAVLRRLPQVRILDGLVNRRAENEQHRADMEERRRRMRASSQAMIERKRRAELRRAAEEGGSAWLPEVPQPTSPEPARSARPSSAPPSLAPALSAAATAPCGAAPARENTPGSPQACGICSFIQSPYSTKVEYDRWRRSRLQPEPIVGPAEERARCIEMMRGLQVGAGCAVVPVPSVVVPEKWSDSGGA